MIRSDPAQEAREALERSTEALWMLGCQLEAAQWSYGLMSAQQALDRERLARLVPQH